MESRRLGEEKGLASLHSGSRDLNPVHLTSTCVRRPLHPLPRLLLRRWQVTFSARLFQKQVDQHGKLFRVPAHAHLLVTRWPWGSCQGWVPASLPAAGSSGHGAEVWSGACVCICKWDRQCWPRPCSLSWPGSQDVTAEVPGHRPRPRTQAAALRPSLLPDPQSGSSKECELSRQPGRGDSPALSLLGGGPWPCGPSGQSLLLGIQSEE